MHVCIFVGGLAGGGTERVVCNLSNYLSKNHHVDIITMSGNTPTYFLDDHVNRISIEGSSRAGFFLIRNVKRLLALNKLIKYSTCNIFLVFLPVTSFILLSFRKKIKVPIIVSERSDPNSYFASSKLKLWIMKKLYPKADAFVFQTKDAQDYYAGIITNESLVIPNAINDEFVKKPFDGQRGKVIVSAGRLDRGKNFSMLVGAFAKISEKHSDYKLIIFGDGELRPELKILISELKLNDKVFLPGYVQNLGDQINAASLFVLPSKFEGIPNALMEAMALGLPSISTDCPCGGPKFLIQDGENGLLVPNNDMHKLAEAMDKILSDKLLAEKLGTNARKICDTLNAEKIYTQWEEFLIKIARKNESF